MKRALIIGAMLFALALSPEAQNTPTPSRQSSPGQTSAQPDSANQESPPSATAPTKPPAAPAKPNATSANRSKTLKLTSTQKQAVDILQAVEGGLARFSPEMQTYLLQEMAAAYRGIDRPEQEDLLKQALQSAAAMPDTEYRSQQEDSIVRELNRVDPAGLASLQNAADAKVREIVSQLLVKQDIDHGRLVAAAQRLSQWDATLAFPYKYAGQVIIGLNAQQTGERQAVFSSAVAAYRTAKLNMDSDEGMTTLILGSANLLPPPTVTDAIDLVLSRATKDSEKDFRVTVGGKNGEATFNSMYDFKLFEFLPILDKLDPPKAESLRRDHDNIAALSKKYPNGMASLSPDSAHMSRMYSSGDPQAGTAELVNTQQERLAESTADSSAKDPDAAIAGAQSLSNTPKWEYAVMTPRCHALEQIATQAVHGKNYTVAASALKALVAALQDLPPLPQAHYFVRAAALSAQMNDPQTAKQYLGKAMKAAAALYQKDAFGDPANDAPKGLWPSTAVWQGALIVGEHVEPGFGLQQAETLPDPEIEAVANVAIATTLLGQEPGMTTLSIWRDGKPEVEMMFDIPWWNMPKAEGNQKAELR